MLGHGHVNVHHNWMPSLMSCSCESQAFKFEYNYKSLSLGDAFQNLELRICHIPCVAAVSQWLKVRIPRRWLRPRPRNSIAPPSKCSLHFHHLSIIPHCLFCGTQRRASLLKQSLHRIFLFIIKAWSILYNTDHNGRLCSPSRTPTTKST